MSYESDRTYLIHATFDRIAQVQSMLDRLLDDARRLRDYDIKTRDSYIEKAQDNLVTFRDDFEKNVLKVKPTAKLDRAYEKDLS